MTTSTFDGLQPALSLYRTENVMVVDGVPEPGDAFPALSTGAGCEAPLQLAAAASLARGGQEDDRDREGNRDESRPALFGSVSGCDGSCAVGSPDPHTAWARP